LPQLVGQKYGWRIEDLAIAESEDEILLQIISLLALGRVHTVQHLFFVYAKRGALSKEKLIILGMMFVESNPDLAIACLGSIRGENSEQIFSIKEILWLIEKAEIKIPGKVKWDTYERHNSKESPFPEETLLAWCEDVLSGPAGGENGKWGAKLVIELYNKGNKTVVTPEAVADYFERHAMCFPDCHGNHRMLSLLGFGASGSRWDLYPHKERIARGIFYLIMNDMKGMHYLAERKYAVSAMTVILLEILESFEDKKFVKELITELIKMLSNCRNNISSLLRRMRGRYSSL
jgi:hypothetical protein